MSTPARCREEKLSKGEDQTHAHTVNEWPSIISAKKETATAKSETAHNHRLTPHTVPYRWLKDTNCPIPCAHCPPSFPPPGPGPSSAGDGAAVRDGDEQQERGCERDTDVAASCLPFSAGSLLPFVVGVFPMIHMSE